MSEGSVDTTANVQAQSQPRVVFSTTPKDQQPFVSAMGILMYIGLWILSLLSPLLLAILYMYNLMVPFYLLGSLIILTVSVPLVVPIHPIPGLSNFYARTIPKYFKHSSLIYEHPLPSPKSSNPTILCVHPHGIFCLGWGILFAQPELHHIHFCFSSILYASPLFGFYSKLISRPSPVDKKTILRILKNKESFAIIPGGFEEATLTALGRDRIWIKSRQGFIKYALQYGYSVTPAYVFGERNTFWNFQGFWPLRLWLNQYSIPAILPIGKWWFPLLPRDRSINIVVGTPLVLPRIENPTNADVKKYHTEYITAVKELYGRHCKKYYEEEQEQELEIW